jgi:WD40 repeat protein/serine/threonine protein kinase
MVSATSRCDRCGASVDGSFVAGLCPACSMALAMGNAEKIPFDGGTSTSAAQQSHLHVAPADASGDISEPAKLPEWIGPYKVLGRIAEGGMGIVYKAEQQRPLIRTVAVKVIKLGMDTVEVVARFEAERQALALMAHPNIATVFDAGATADGRPYFAMEYVPGEPITTYCDRNALTLLERLLLFVQACEAVQHAHHKGIIHRDVKPSNVLVTAGADGRPLVKAIDFGIAKALSARLTEQTLYTEHGRLVGTPGYVSPEQLERGSFDVDTRADVYALGVLLYELLIGALPCAPEPPRASGALAGLHRIVDDDEPPRPSVRLTALKDAERAQIAAYRATSPGALDRDLRSELEWIPLKAMRNDRTERYQSAFELADDVRNYLEGRALLAGPRSRTYLVRKFARAHRAGLSMFAAVLFVIIGLIVWLLMMSQRATSAEASLWLEKASRAEAGRHAAELAQHQAEFAFRAAETTMSERLVQFGDSLAGLGKPAGAVERYLQARETARELGINDAPIVARLFSLGERDVPLMGSYGAGGGVGGFAASGHPNGVALSRDGATAVTCDETANLSVWDVRTGRLLRHVATAHKGGGAYIAISSDDSLVLCAGFDHRVSLWEVATGTLRGKLEGHSSGVYIAIFGPDGHTAVSADDQGTVIRWDLDAMTEVNRWQAHAGAIGALAFSQDGQTLASGGNDGWIKLWAAETGDPMRSLGPVEGKIKAINSIAWGADDRTIVSGGFDGAVRLWDLKEPANNRVVGKHGDWVWRVTLSPDGASVASGCRDGTVRIWDIASGRQAREFEGHTGEVLGLAFTRDGRYLVAGGSDSCLRVWAVAEAGRFRRVAGVEGATCITFSEQGLAFLGTSRGAVVIYDRFSGRVLRELRGEHSKNVTAVRVAQQGAVVLSGGRDGAVTFWDVAKGQEVRHLHTDGSAVLDLALASDHAVVIRSEQRVRLWDFVANKSADIEVGPVACVASSPDAEAYLTVSKEGTVRVHSSQQGDRSWPLPAGFGSPRYAGLAPGGRTAVVASVDKLWVAEMASAKVSGPFTTHVGDVAGLGFLSDGLTLWLIGTGGAAELWDVQQGTPIGHIAAAPANVATFALAPGGQCGASVDTAGSVHMWEFDTAAIQHDFESRVPRARDALDQIPDDGDALATFGEWFALRGKADWALDFLGRAATNGGRVPHLTLARCHWREGHAQDAAREFNLARDNGEMSPLYHDLCIRAVSLPPNGPTSVHQ